jgi:AcrR family transcriptional regulator
MVSTTKVGRRYRLGRRAETTGETRRRIVEATFDLHSERGIADTSMTDIAERAGVSVGTVYHHFPSYADAIVACGAYTAEHAPAPTRKVLEGVASRHERITRPGGRLLRTRPGLESVRRDRRLTATGCFCAEEVRTGAGSRRKPSAGRPGGAGRRSCDIDVYRSLRREGFGTADAADRLAVLLNQALDAAPGASRRTVKE